MPSLTWIGREAVERHHSAVPFHLLHADPLRSAGDVDSGNLLVEGDNLVALKALLPFYAGQVKCIYIDPPYNTGNEGWIYNDNANSQQMREWLGKVVGRQGEDLSRHDKWLCMMYPRLVLLRQMLRDDGSFWMSIDDNEVHHSRMLLDEIFGEKNFVANVVWQKKYAVANDHKSIAPMHDHILVYQKSGKFQRNLLPRTQQKDRQYRFEDQQGIFRLSDYTCNKTAQERSNLYYPVINPNTGEEIWPSRTRVWAYDRESHQLNESKGLVWWGKDGQGKVPAYKRYLHSLRGGGGIVPPTWWTFEDVGHTDEAKKEIRRLDIAGDALDFITPKPTRLIERILHIATDPGDLVLDSFAGSGTTGHAVLKAGGNRRFILVEMEPAIATPITAERLARVITGYGKTAGLGGGFQYCTLGQTLFDAAGRIRPEVSFAELARFVYFHATGGALAQDAAVTSPLLGVHHDTAVYLLYNGILKDKSAGGGNALTRQVLAGLPAHAGPKLIYGVRSLLGADRLRREGVTFRHIPTDLQL